MKIKITNGETCPMDDDSQLVELVASVDIADADAFDLICAKVVGDWAWDTAPEEMDGRWLASFNLTMPINDDGADWIRIKDAQKSGKPALRKALQSAARG